MSLRLPNVFITREALNQMYLLMQTYLCSLFVLIKNISGKLMLPFQRTSYRKIFFPLWSIHFSDELENFSLTVELNITCWHYLVIRVTLLASM